ncbi:hypothetical protein OsJ_34753 [Oryza sativa Japonica Group]|uniref:Uncharacterized protein n=1 Tax=Oryza sativa subsp. japonica TaxID=39947 RepID=B9G8R6_ORYSJ|nr:hypothetical protein OsJ_34753 [Oryza sativa Japonica Group]
MSVALPQDHEENDDEGSQRSPPAKRLRNSCDFDDKQTEMLQEILRMNRMMQQQNERIKLVLRENQELREKVSSLTAAISEVVGYHKRIPAPRMLPDQNCSEPLRLQFVNSCSNDKYSTHKIEADDESPLQWTEEYFRSKIVPGRPQKGHLLSGKLYFRLQNGVGYLNAKFQDNSSFVPSKKFKLGVMAADERISERIQEGITESFAVKDVRGYLTKKNPNPSPRDAVYKLSKIAKNGDRHKLLEQNGIKTVEDFLSFYNKSPDDLRKILGKISDQDWDLIISHALKCNPRPGIYSSCLQESNVSHEHEAFFRSNGSYYLQGSCSMQPSHTSQGQLERIQVVDRQVSSVGNEVMSVSSMDNNMLEVSSSQQQHSLGHINTAEIDGNGLSHANPSDWNSSLDWIHGHADVQLESMVNAQRRENLLSEYVGRGEHDFTGTPGSGVSCSAAEQNWGHSPVTAAEQNWGHSPVSEAGSMNYNGAVNEAGSWSHRGLPPSRAAGSRRHRRHSFSPARGAGSRRHREARSSSYGEQVFGEASSSDCLWFTPLPPVLFSDNISNTSKIFHG